MSDTSELLAQQILNGNINKKTWGQILYNVYVFGAVGDGVRDDTQAVQDAIDTALFNNATLVYFPPGTYKVTSLGNTETINFVGDNASFVGYSGVIQEFGVTTYENSPYPVYNVKYGYGAKGDYVSDDTVGIQSAIDAASSAGGGTVWFPPGTYKLTTAITVPANVTIYGDASAVLKWANGILDTYRAGIQITGENGRVIGITLDCNSKQTLNGIGVITNKKFLIDSVVIKNCYDYGIWVFEGLIGAATTPAGNDVSGEGFITNCDVSARDCYEVYSGRKVTISNCIARGDALRVTAPSSSGYYIWGRGQNVVVQGCFALGSYTIGGFAVTGKESTVAQPRDVRTSVTFNGCQAILDSGAGAGFYIYDSSLVRGEGNFVSHLGSGVGLSISQSNPTPGSSKNIVFGATISTNTGFPVRIDAVSDVELHVNLETTSAANLVWFGGAGKRAKFVGGTFKMGSTVGAASFYAIITNAFTSITFDGVTFVGSSTGYEFRNNVFTVEQIKIVNCIFDGTRINIIQPGGYTQIANCQFMDYSAIIPVGGNFYINCAGADKYSIVGNVGVVTATVSNLIVLDAGVNKVVANNLMV